MTFSGVLTALVTPFRGGQVDQTIFRQLVQRQLASQQRGAPLAPLAARRRRCH